MVHAQVNNDHLFLSKDEEDGEKKGSAPRGFEKFLKKTRKGAPKTEDKKEAEGEKERRQSSKKMMMMKHLKKKKLHQRKRKSKVSK